MISAVKILAIEDDPGDVELLRRYLQDVPDLKLEFVDRLSSGLKLISENQIDLVLLDLGLPDSQGLDTVTRFRSQSPDMPVVVLTGLTDEALGIAAVRMGAQDYLVKGQSNRSNLNRSIHYAIERQAIQKALRKSQALLKEAQRVAHIGHWELDTPTGTPTWSEEIFHIFGRDPAQGVLSFPAHRNITYPEDWESLHSAVTEALTHGTAFNIEFRLIHPEKSVCWVEVRGYPAGNAEGGRFRLFGTIQDITERKEMESLLQQRAEDLARSNQDLEQFAFVASHDLQEPLRNVATALQMLEKQHKGKLGEDSDQLIHFAVDGAKKMKALIRDLLIYSRLNTRGQPLQVVNMREILDQSILNLKSLIDQKGTKSRATICRLYEAIEHSCYKSFRI